MSVQTRGPLTLEGAHALRCTRCAAGLEHDDVRCAICGLLAPVQERAASAVRAQIVRCGSCGAGVTYSAEARAPRCAFCTSVMKLETPADPVEQAQAALPFRVTPDQAGEALRTWLKGLGFFRPAKLHQEATLESLRAIWWPAWVFNAVAEVSWTADSNAGSGRSAWAPHAGQVGLNLEDLLVPASRGLTVEECRKLAGSFNLATAQPEPSGPAGATVELFETSRSGARKLILEAVESAARGAVEGGRIPGTRFRKVHCSALLSGLTTQRVSMPTYVLAYRYRKALYRVLVHGQDPSCVLGKAPLSVWKILGAIVTGLAVLGAVLALLASQR